MMAALEQGAMARDRSWRRNLEGFGPEKLIFILLVVMLIFGAKRLPEIGSGLGKGIREFKRSVRGDLDEAAQPPQGYPTQTYQPPVQPQQFQAPVQPQQIPAAIPVTQQAPVERTEPTQA